MILKNKIDSHGNYYEFRILNSSLMTIFIHGVGLDNTMWFPQKEYFNHESVLFYDLLNHGQSSGDFKELSFDIYSNQLLNLIEDNKVEDVKNVLSRLVTSYQSNSEIVDHFYEQQSKLKQSLSSSKDINDENKVIRIKSK